SWHPPCTATRHVAPRPPHGQVRRGQRSPLYGAAPRARGLAPEPVRRMPDPDPQLPPGGGGLHRRAAALDPRATHLDRDLPPPPLRLGQPPRPAEPATQLPKAAAARPGAPRSDPPGLEDALRSAGRLHRDAVLRAAGPPGDGARYPAGRRAGARPRAGGRDGL